MNPQESNHDQDTRRTDTDTTSPTSGSKRDLSKSNAAAKHYVREHGFAVFPCRPGDKRPATKNGCKDATTDATTIERTIEPRHNVAIATGPMSGVFVVDIDGDAGEASLAVLEDQHGRLPATVTAKTPRGGRHLYFRLPTGLEICNSASRLGESIDIRGAGGYVVAPPSRLPNGFYAWVAGLGPDESAVADPPAWLVTAVTRSRTSETSVSAGIEIPEGRRNDSLTSLAGKLRRAGLDQLALEAALISVNRDHCHPPLPKSEVQAIAKSVTRYATGNEAGLEFKPFPVEGLPEPVRGLVANAADAIGCDPCYVALPLLTGCAAAIGNTRRVQLKPGWCELAIVWTAIVGDSGTMKSPALEIALRPVKQRQKDAWKQAEFERGDYQAKKLDYEKDLARWKKPSSIDPPPTPPEEPVVSRTCVDETTMEALASLLEQNPRGLLDACNELASWLSGFDKYNQGAGTRPAGSRCTAAEASPSIASRATRKRSSSIGRLSASPVGSSRASCSAC